MYHFILTIVLFTIGEVLVLHILTKKKEFSVQEHIIRVIFNVYIEIALKCFFISQKMI